jgi:hypothetical protein
MSETKEKNFNINNPSFNNNSFHPNINLNLINSSKDYSLKELKTSHNGLVCINYNSEYLRERIYKLKEESNYLKQKINEIETINLKEKNNLEKIIISLREENHILKQNISTQKEALNQYSLEKEKIINELKESKKINNELNKEKNILMERLKESNNVINNDISPKLKNNESDLAFLKNKINEMQKTIINLKNEKLRLIDDNVNQNEMIKVLTTQNKKLLKEIKMKYNKDLNFIQDIEKFGIETNLSNSEIYEEMKSRYENDKNKKELNIKKVKNLKTIKNEKNKNKQNNIDLNDYFTTF